MVGICFSTLIRDLRLICRDANSIIILVDAYLQEQSILRLDLIV